MDDQPVIHILNGPNLNMLGLREPEIYGTQTLDDIKAACIEAAQKHQIRIDFRQSNHEGQLVDWIQEIAISKPVPLGLIINAAAYTHTSVALHDALKCISCPVIEVHLSNPKEREPFRHHSYIEPLAQKVFVGEGIQGYIKAVNHLCTTL